MRQHSTQLIYKMRKWTSNDWVSSSLLAMHRRRPRRSAAGKIDFPHTHFSDVLRALAYICGIYNRFPIWGVARGSFSRLASHRTCHPLRKSWKITASHTHTRHIHLVLPAETLDLPLSRIVYIRSNAASLDLKNMSLPATRASSRPQLRSFINSCFDKLLYIL